MTVLATARVTRLVTGDTITEPARHRIELLAAMRDNGDGTARLAPWPWRFLAGVIRCHWCASIWISAATTTLYSTWATGTCPLDWTASTWFLTGAFLLSTSYSVATAADWLDSPPPVQQHEVRMRRDT